MAGKGKIIVIKEDHMLNEFVLEKFDNGMHYIMLDSKTIKKLTINQNRRVICAMNGKVEFHCALMPKKEGGYFIIVGSSVCRKLKIQAGSKIRATFTIDQSEYQFEMPEELSEVLDTDPEAREIFHSLTAGNQRGLMYLVAQVKSSEKRIERALKIAARIKAGITSPRTILK
ncbi:MAG TPA: YdeI/OmpD-associated family protein [Chitinophagaceae bacterium]|nr:YdeI/OmpD-associated family protein [Chitinophagaceae bacterium]